MWFEKISRLIYDLFQRPWLLRYKMNLKCTNLAFSSAAAKAAALASAASASALALASASASAFSASSLKQVFMYEFKVQLFWEGHKNMQNLPHGFDVY